MNDKNKLKMENSLVQKRENLIVTLTEDFAVKIIAFHTRIKKAGVEAMANQLFRSGTSIGANVCEAQGAESRRDFIHKLKISSKEAEETEFWLKLCKRSDLLPDPGDLLIEIKSIIKVLNKIITTCRQNKTDSL
jgi:four helix bundle protein